MLERNRQYVGENNQGKVSIVNGDNNHIGLEPNEVLDLCNKVVDIRLQEMRLDAQLAAKEEIKAFSDEFSRRLACLENIYIERLSRPSIQLALNDALIGILRNPAQDVAESMLDLLIERVLTDEGSTIQKVIDRAITILPSLSAESIAILTLYVFSKLSINGNRDYLESWYKSVMPLLKLAVKASKLDISFLNQVGCTTGIKDISSDGRTFVEKARSNHDLFFRHSVSAEKASWFYKKYIDHIEGENAKLNMKYSNELAEVMVNTVRLNTIQEIDFSEVSKESALKRIDEAKQEEYKSDFISLVECAKPFTEQEIYDWFKDLDSVWPQVIATLDSVPVLCLDLQPVGIYIACRQISRLFGQTVDMNMFYK